MITSDTIHRYLKEVVELPAELENTGGGTMVTHTPLPGALVLVAYPDDRGGVEVQLTTALGWSGEDEVASENPILIQNFMHLDHAAAFCRGIYMLARANSAWVRIERQHGPDLMVGPYPTEDDAVRAVEYSVLIDGLCEEDAIECRVDRGQPQESDEQVIIDFNDPHHAPREEYPL